MKSEQRGPSLIGKVRRGSEGNRQHANLIEDELLVTRLARDRFIRWNSRPVSHQLAKILEFLSTGGQSLGLLLVLRGHQRAVMKEEHFRSAGKDRDQRLVQIDCGIGPERIKPATARLFTGDVRQPPVDEVAFVLLLVTPLV